MSDWVALCIFIGTPLYLGVAWFIASLLNYDQRWPVAWPLVIVAWALRAVYESGSLAWRVLLGKDES